MSDADDGAPSSSIREIAICGEPVIVEDGETAADLLDQLLGYDPSFDVLVTERDGDVGTDRVPNDLSTVDDGDQLWVQQVTDAVAYETSSAD